jgi:hypothetical protein
MPHPPNMRFGKISTSAAFVVVHVATCPLNLGETERVILVEL